MLDARNHQGKFGQDYVRVLASAAGLLVYTPDLDYDGVDFLIRWPGQVGAAASPAIDVQIKSWSTPQKLGGAWHFDGLNENQFNKLAGQNYTVPRYLFLVVVPKIVQTFSEVLTEGMLLRYQAYYVSLREQAPIPEPSPRRKHMVDVPIGNVLTVSTLLALMNPGLATPGGGR